MRVKGIFFCLHIKNCNMRMHSFHSFDKRDYITRFQSLFFRKNFCVTLLTVIHICIEVVAKSIGLLLVLFTSYHGTEQNWNSFGWVRWKYIQNRKSLRIRLLGLTLKLRLNKQENLQRKRFMQWWDVIPIALNSLHTLSSTE